MTGKSGQSAGTFLLSRATTGVSRKTFLLRYRLDDHDATVLRLAAREDARRYVYNALLSFLSGMASLSLQNCAWAVTQMYYTAFYVGRASLCRAGRVIFHVQKEGGQGHTQYEIQALPGNPALVVDKPASTHKLVAARFRSGGYPTFMRSLQVDGIDPLMWLMEQREYWQYRSGRFPDPELPDVLEGVDMRKVQQLLSQYAADSTGVYLADRAHALVCIPFRLVAWALAQDDLMSPGVIDPEDIAYLIPQRYWRCFPA